MNKQAMKRFPNSNDRQIAMMIIEVRLLRDDQAPFHLEVMHDAPGQWLFNKVIDHLGDLVEKEYFGLRYLDRTKQRQWLDLSKSVYKQLKHVTPKSLNFRVKHYPSKPLEELKSEKTRYLLYLQLRRDLHSGRLVGKSSEMHLIAAQILQAEIGDHVELDDLLGGSGSLTDLQMFANMTPRVETKIKEAHKNLSGLTPAKAEAMFLEHASHFDTYGVEPLLVQDRKGNGFFAGLSHEGVVTFRENKKVHVFAWNKIHKISYDGKLFIIIVEWEQRKHTLGFKCQTKEAAKALWKWAVDRQCFFTLNRAVDAKESKSSGGLFKKKEFHLFTGRCQKELLQVNASMPNIQQESVQRSRSLLNLAVKVSNSRKGSLAEGLDRRLSMEPLDRKHSFPNHHGVIKRHQSNPGPLNRNQFKENDQPSDVSTDQKNGTEYENASSKAISQNVLHRELNKLAKEEQLSSYSNVTKSNSKNSPPLIPPLAPVKRSSDKTDNTLLSPESTLSPRSTNLNDSSIFKDNYPEDKMREEGTPEISAKSQVRLEDSISYTSSSSLGTDYQTTMFQSNPQKPAQIGVMGAGGVKVMNKSSSSNNQSDTSKQRQQETLSSGGTINQDATNLNPTSMTTLASVSPPSCETPLNESESVSIGQNLANSMSKNQNNMNVKDESRDKSEYSEHTLSAKNCSASTLSSSSNNTATLQNTITQSSQILSSGTLEPEGEEETLTPPKRTTSQQKDLKVDTQMQLTNHELDNFHFPYIASGRSQVNSESERKDRLPTETPNLSFGKRRTLELYRQESKLEVTPTKNEMDIAVSRPAITRDSREPQTTMAKPPMFPHYYNDTLFNRQVTRNTIQSQTQLNTTVPTSLDQPFLLNYGYSLYKRGSPSCEDLNSYASLSSTLGTVPYLRSAPRSTQNIHLYPNDEGFIGAIGQSMNSSRESLNKSYNNVGIKISPWSSQLGKSNSNEAIDSFTFAPAQRRSNHVAPSPNLIDNGTFTLRQALGSPTQPTETSTNVFRSTVPRFLNSDALDSPNLGRQPAVRSSYSTTQVNRESQIGDTNSILTNGHTDLPSNNLIERPSRKLYQSETVYLPVKNLRTAPIAFQPVPVQRSTSEHPRTATRSSLSSERNTVRSRHSPRGSNGSHSRSSGTVRFRDEVTPTSTDTTPAAAHHTNSSHSNSSHVFSSVTRTTPDTVAGSSNTDHHHPQHLSPTAEVSMSNECTIIVPPRNVHMQGCSNARAEAVAKCRPQCSVVYKTQITKPVPSPRIRNRIEYFNQRRPTESQAPPGS